MDPPMKCPAFFKVFIPARSSQRLRIPLAFTVHVKQLIPDKAYLRNRVGKLWPVEVGKIGNDLFFEDGWVRFIQDNGVEIGDFFVFQYDGNYVFDFKLFGRTACEKEVFSKCDFKVKEEDDEEEEEVEEEEEKGEVAEEEEEEEEEEEVEEEEEKGEVADEEENGEDEEEKGEVADEEENGEDEEEKGEVAEEEEHGEDEEEEEEENKEDMEDDSDEEDEEFEEEEEEEGDNDDEELEEENYPKRKPKTCKNSVRCKGNAAANVEGRDKRSEGIEIQYDDIFESGKYARPKNPYFVTKMRNTRRSELYIPLDVITDNNIILDPKIVLKDEEGREWNSRVVVWKDGRTWLSKGWKAFCKWNHLKDEDLCICEFVRGRGRVGTFMQVQIARMGSW